jgi:hypothetical protein
LYVDTIQQWAGDFVAIASYLIRCATAFAIVVAQKSAQT